MWNSGKSIRLLSDDPDPRVPLMNLSRVRTRIDSLQQYLSETVNSNRWLSRYEMEMVSAQISDAIHEIISNATALLAFTQQPSESPDHDLKTESKKINHQSDYFTNYDIVEIDAVDLIAQHVHICEICGKGFKRDANLRMHMRSHGDRFKTPQALAKRAAAELELMSTSTGRKTRFSCPFEGCNRNKKHNKFRPMKSVICAKNHFRRSHCPKLYSCDRCHKRRFSVVADLKSHLKRCGGDQSRWKCSCGTKFSRKDKLVGHMAVFEGHVPAAVEEKEEKAGGEAVVKAEEFISDSGFSDEGWLVDGFDPARGYGWTDGTGDFCGFV